MIFFRMVLHPHGVHMVGEDRKCCISGKFCYNCPDKYSMAPNSAGKERKPVQDRRVQSTALFSINNPDEMLCYWNPRKLFDKYQVSRIGHHPHHKLTPIPSDFTKTLRLGTYNITYGTYGTYNLK